LLVCLNILYNFLLAMDLFYKLCVKIDLASLHYITFIELLAVIPMESLSFGLDQFMNSSINKLIE
jgi:hypothetical protein